MVEYEYDSNIILEWDEDKCKRNIEERGIDFADAAEVLVDPNMTLYLDNRRDYGEIRFNAYGLSKDRKIRMCFTLREDKVRVITMFRVHDKEWSKYYEQNNENGGAGST
jgi:uncharacterized DUF497 family protein